MNLEAKVKAVNRANAYALQLYATLKPIFEPLVGKTILKADGLLLSKYRMLLPSMPSRPSLSVYRHPSNYSLAWTVRTSEMDSPNTCLYHHVTVYVGDLQGSTLAKISPPEGLRTDFTVEEIQQKQHTCQQAKGAYEEARQALYPFGD